MPTENQNTIQQAIAKKPTQNEHLNDTISLFFPQSVEESQAKHPTLHLSLQEPFTALDIRFLQEKIKGSQWNCENMSSSINVFIEEGHITDCHIDTLIMLFKDSQINIGMLWIKEKHITLQAAFKLLQFANKEDVTILLGTNDLVLQRGTCLRDLIPHCIGFFNSVPVVDLPTAQLKQVAGMIFAIFKRYNSHRWITNNPKKTAWVIACLMLTIIALLATFIFNTYLPNLAVTAALYTSIGAGVLWAASFAYCCFIKCRGDHQIQYIEEKLKDTTSLLNKKEIAYITDYIPSTFFSSREIDTIQSTLKSCDIDDENYSWLENGNKGTVSFERSMNDLNL